MKHIAVHFDDLLLGGRRPVLYVPPGEAPARRIRPLHDSVVVGWDRSRESMRALQDALPILHKARHTFVLSVNRESSGHEHHNMDADDACAHLDRYGVHAAPVNVACAATQVGERVLSFAKETDASLLVVGAYGHSRLGEVLFGGVTRHLLADSNLPVFMSH